MAPKAGGRHRPPAWLHGRSRRQCAAGPAPPNDRRVGLRPLPDTMAGLSAFLPVEQGVACLGRAEGQVDALKAAGDPRTRGQIAADTLVERLTGQATADDVDIEVQITVPVQNLLGPNQHQPAEVHGYGPIPAGLADQIIAHTSGSRWWRRLFTTPTRNGRGTMIIGRRPPPHAGSPAGSPNSSRCETALPRTLLHRPDPPPRPPHSRPDDGPTTPTTAAASANTTTTSARCRGWKVTTVSQTGEPTPPSPPPPPGSTTSAAPPTHPDARRASQRENRLPDTVVTKFFIESGRSRRCQFCGPAYQGRSSGSGSSSVSAATMASSQRSVPPSTIA